MTRLTENKVQSYAMAFLQKKYRAKAKAKNLFSKEEVRTRKEYGGKRADGLLAYEHWWRGICVVSMEAKSYKTLPAIQARLDFYKLLWNSLKAGLLVCIASGAVFAIYRMDDQLFQFLLPLNAFVIGGLTYGLLTINSYRNMTLKVVEQVMQYPANEKWLAFSKDSMTDLKKKDRKALKQICKYEGVGVLIVHPTGKVESWIKAVAKRKWFGNYLSYYSLEKRILKLLR